MTRQNYLYTAGILDKGDSWLWQGYVIAPTKSSAQKLLRKYQKKALRVRGKVVIDSFLIEKTNKKVGVITI